MPGAPNVLMFTVYCMGVVDRGFIVPMHVLDSE
jgi:hypothetical protein